MQCFCRNTNKTIGLSKKTNRWTKTSVYLRNKKQTTNIFNNYESVGARMEPEGLIVAQNICIFMFLKKKNSVFVQRLVLFVQPMGFQMEN